jgi:hypothetical protein
MVAFSHQSASPPGPAAIFPPIRRGALTTLQVNLTHRCNQTCSHCHVNAGPTRIETMDAATVALIPEVLTARGIQTLDLAGGAPELHPQFRQLAVIDRCHLTILSEPGQEGLAAFLAQQGVTVVASRPCYSAGNVDRQRGQGGLDRSITALEQLNALGYGYSGSGLELHLVYNPQGPVLPPPQAKLEADDKRELARHVRPRLQPAAGAIRWSGPAGPPPQQSAGPPPPRSLRGSDSRGPALLWLHRRQRLQLRWRPGLRAGLPMAGAVSGGRRHPNRS